MIFTVAILVGLTIAAVALVLVPATATRRVVFDVRPDRPAAFGYSMSWLALKTEDTAAVVEALGLEDKAAANWSSGIGTVYDAYLGERRVFVSPPVEGWTFIVGLSLPHPLPGAFVDKWHPLVDELSRRFREAQFYMTYPAIDFYAWSRVVEGRIVRAFAIGDSGIVLSHGRTTKEEKALGMRHYELRGVRGRSGDAGGELVIYPTEDHIVQLAGKWSVDPTRLGATGAPAGLGVIATAPTSWRPERQRKAA